MKSYDNLYPGICTLENLYEAASKARRHKTRREDVERFELHRERFIRQLHEELTAERWQPSAYRRFTIHDPKTRQISAAPFRDRVVHHALVNVIGPLLERRFVDDSYSCRQGKGTLAGRERCRAFTNRYRHALKCDVRRYFESVDHGLLMEKLARTIRCRPTLELCRRIIASGGVADAPAVWVAGDDLLTPIGRPRGLPIGNLTSRIAAELDRDRLALHPAKTRLLQTRDGVPFLGFRFFPGRAPRSLGECKRRFERRMRHGIRSVRKGTMDMDAIRKSAAGWQAFADYGNVKGLYGRYRAESFG